MYAIVGAEEDPLSSWNDGAVKTTIITFVENVTKEGSANFVPPAERVGAFDNDRMLQAEQPVYFQFQFALDRVKALTLQHPEWKQKQPLKALDEANAKGRMVVNMKHDWKRIFPFEAESTGNPAMEFMR
jgi:hypothetical protein